jgi:hypothetical protein
MEIGLDLDTVYIGLRHISSVRLTMELPEQMK